MGFHFVRVTINLASLIVTVPDGTPLNPPTTRSVVSAA